MTWSEPCGKSEGISWLPAGTQEVTTPSPAGPAEEDPSRGECSSGKTNHLNWLVSDLLQVATGTLSCQVIGQLRFFRFTGSTFPVSISYYRSCQLLARLLLWNICRKWWSDYLWLGLQRFHLQKKLRYGNEAQVINYHWFLLLWKQQHRKPEWRLLSIFFFFTVSL